MQIRNNNVVFPLLRPMPQPYGDYNFPRPTYGGKGSPGFEGLKGCSCGGSDMPSMQGLLGLGGFGLLGLGATSADQGLAPWPQADAAVDDAQAQINTLYAGQVDQQSPPQQIVIDTRVLWAWQGILSFVGASAGAVHGYKRSRGSAMAALGWGVAGFLFPVITVPVALVQGFGKPRRRRS